MNKILISTVAIILIAGLSFAFVSITKNNSETAGAFNTAEQSGEVAFKSTEESFKWFTVQEAIELNKTTGKKIFIDVYTNWCGPCKWLETNTFSAAIIRKQLSQYYIPTKFNAEGNDTIFFQNQTFVNKNPNAAARMSTHEFTLFIAQTKNGIAYPTMVFLDENLNMIQPIAGALTAQQLEPILEYIGGDFYKNTDWVTYQQTFKSASIEAPINN